MPRFATDCPSSTLRNQGFRASRDPAGKLLAPRHAFVVVDTGGQGSAEGPELVFVETQLAELFTAARPSAHLLTLLRELPDVFVGVAAQLEMIVNVVSAALSASFKSQGLPLPPWRRALMTRVSLRISRSPGESRSGSSEKTR